MLSYIHHMECSVLFTDEFESWWNSLSIEEQESVTYSVDLLAHTAPGPAHRVLYAFDPERNAVLLIGGDKTGNEQWYETFVPLADRLYERRLHELEESDDHGKSKKL